MSWHGHDNAVTALDAWNRWASGAAPVNSVSSLTAIARRGSTIKTVGRSMHNDSQWCSNDSLRNRPMNCRISPLENMPGVIGTCLPELREKCKHRHGHRISGGCVQLDANVGRTSSVPTYGAMSTFGRR